MKDRSNKPDVHQQVTDRIIAMIEAGAGDFSMPWHRGSPIEMPKNALTKKRYRGINVVSLWVAAQSAGFTSNTWGTYRQWQERGGQVRKGERGSVVVVYKEFHVEPDEKNDDDDGRRMFARASWVFNAQQCDGIEVDAHPTVNNGSVSKNEAAENFLRASGAIIKTGGSRAFYRPATDHIQMPDEHLFLGDDRNRTEAWYSTALHELTHWSGAQHRLNREKGCRFGDAKYAFEELVAELGAAFLCSILGITNEPRKDHAQYIASWLRLLKHDKRAIFSASAKASAAADYLEALAAPQQMAA